MPALSWPSWFPLRGKAAETTTASGIARAQREDQALGPWTGTFQTFVARQVNPHLYEAMREALPIVDGGIGMMVTLDGIVRVEGEDEALVAEIDAWMQSVQVNDAETGLQAFYASQGNEQYEQGFAVGEWTARKDGKGIERLRVADSKGVMFLREGDTLRTYYRAPAVAKPAAGAGLETVESMLRRTPALTPAGLLQHDYQPLDPRRVVYVANQPEADNPYGTSLLRSLEVTADTQLRVQVSLGRTWTRWGDPVFHVGYKTKNARITETELGRRKAVLAEELAAALAGKERGNSSDFVTATGSLDDIVINAIGAAAVALDPTAPLKHVNEQVCARFGLPPWLLGVDGTVGAGQAERQAEMVLQASKTRWERRRPGLESLVATHLRLAGRAWKPGSWRLVQDLPNLQDMMKIAQAEFLHAQAAMVGGRGAGDAPQGIDNNLRTARTPRGKRTGSVHAKAADDDDTDGEPWAEDDDHLPRIERTRIRAALANWWAFAAAAGGLLGFEVARRAIRPRDADAETWSFPRDRLPDLLVLAQRFVLDNSTDDAPVLGAAWDAWVRGASNAASELSVSAEIGRFQDLVRAELRTRGGELIRSAFARAWQDRILGEMASGAWDGMNPLTVAAALQRKFGAGEYDWERLVRSEMAIAQSRAKREIYTANGVQRYDYTTAGDAKVSEICQALAASGPYDIGAPDAPIPVISSHPNCRCSIAPHIPD
jgi:SPP1 gp7 family putative phage head morphogenesis protein